ncbi:MAG: hypothetical protein VYB44_07245 [Bacteroidota bacterium]|nr:hypothetical protein [Bacteroidota bacterium]
MKNSENTPEKSGIIVTFHIGRGGRFHNPGHKTFLGEDFAYKHDVENKNFLAFKNEAELIENNGEELLEKINEVPHDITSPEYVSFCEKYGDLGSIILQKESGNYIGDYAADGEAFSYDEDGEYDTTYGISIEDCDEEELEIIVSAEGYKSAELIEWINENTNYQLDGSGCLIEEEEIED